MDEHTTGDKEKLLEPNPPPQTRETPETPKTEETAETRETSETAPPSEKGAAEPEAKPLVPKEIFWDRLIPALKKAWKITRLTAAAICKAMRLTWAFLKKHLARDTWFGPAFTMLCITAAFAAALTILHGFTAGAAEAARRDTETAAMCSVLGAPVFTPVNDEKTMYAGTDEDGVFTGYAVFVTVDGAAGPIRMVVGVSADITVTGLSVLSHSEPPNGAALIGDGAYAAQLTGLTLPVSAGIDAIGAEETAAALLRGAEQAMVRAMEEVSKP